ncbi:membrane-bound transcription factor site-2 protease-like [Tigriopus californicus]|uniref:membrane-bound transcription factor site-2 protease-like n=1 Tax=Tigriopus californicus TaxID=6832 RepID=UPI0027DA1745|nr:membrane-bound transcription factor site-2 protease-like [Tigriopus californicus]
MSSLFAHLLAVCGMLYAVIYFVDTVFKSCMLYPYLMFLSRNGIEVKPFRLSFFTKSLNRFFVRSAHWRPRLSYWWFTIGAYVSAFLVIPAMILLVKTFIEALVPLNSELRPKYQGIVLQPVMPGVNMPISELGYYFLTLLSCSAFHEAGHAIAAVGEDVRVVGFGFFLMFVLPAAYVNLPTDQLLALRPFQQLKIFAAGIWHNVVLAGFAYLLLLSIPTMSKAFYTTNEGLYLTSVGATSSVRGPTGLEPGQIVTSINHHCLVQDSKTWRACLLQVIGSPDLGHCVPFSMVQDLDTSKRHAKSGPEDCCDVEDSSSSLCFLSTKNANKSAYCLPVRQILEKATPGCNETVECASASSICLHVAQTNGTKLVQLQRKNEKDFLFVGNPAEIYHGISTSDYIPKHQYLSARLPDMAELFCHYLASFSGALAILNVVPCFFLDGQHMIRVLVDLLCGCFEPGIRSIISLTFTIIGSILLVANLIVGMWQLF